MKSNKNIIELSTSANRTLISFVNDSLSFICPVLWVFIQLEHLRLIYLTLYYSSEGKALCISFFIYYISC